ncbi:hypothetical protein KDA23_04500 [Candidatus Saccharibacteria bacterium]|nr:hypothetical protein [Candidatus Saccharibacteria bacterium]
MLLNLPLIMAGLLGSLIDFKTNKISHSKYWFLTFIWLVILGGLLATQPALSFLYSKGLTATNELSLLDVVELTGIIYLLFIANRARIKADVLERRLNDLHQELSIRLADIEKKRK